MLAGGDDVGDNLADSPARSALLLHLLAALDGPRGVGVQNLELVPHGRLTPRGAAALEPAADGRLGGRVGTTVTRVGLPLG